MHRAAKSISILALTTLAAGCGVTPLPATLGGSSSAVALDLQDPPVEIYSRVARGALSCWFGAQGSLKKTHIFHADVAPVSNGGGAEITIHERDGAAQNPRSIRAYRIIIERSGEGSSVAMENFRLPQRVASDLTADIGRWAKGETRCSQVGAGGWDAQPGKAEPPSAATKKKGR